MSSAPGNRGIAFNDDDFDCVDDAVAILLLIGGGANATTPGQHDAQILRVSSSGRKSTTFLSIFDNSSSFWYTTVVSKEVTVSAVAYIPCNCQLFACCLLLLATCCCFVACCFCFSFLWYFHRVCNILIIILLVNCIPCGVKFKFTLHSLSHSPLSITLSITPLPQHLQLPS